MTFLKRALATAADVKHIIRSEPVHPEYELVSLLSIHKDLSITLFVVGEQLFPASNRGFIRRPTKTVWELFITYLQL